MMKKLKEHKKEIAIFLIVFVVALIMCSAFLRPHYTHDTYRIIYDGYEYYSYDKFLKESRPFTAILTLIADKINLSIESYMIISLILALVFLSMSVVLIYKIFRKEYESNSKWTDILIIIISYLTVYNYLAIEYIYFLECCILAFGVLLSILAAKIVIDDEKYKYIKAFIIIVIAAFCYQGSIAIFPMIVFTYELLFQKNSVKKNFAHLVKTTVIYGIAMLLTILFAEIIMGGSRIRMDAAQISSTNIIYWLKELVVNSLGVILPYINIAIIILTCLFIMTFKKTDIKEKILYTLKYLLVILASIVICIAPIVVGSGLELTSRMCIAYGSTIGISLFVALLITNKNQKNYQVVIISIITIIIFILNFAVYVVLTYQHLEVNKIDKENCEKIKELIEEYEQETGMNITKIAGIHRANGSKYYKGFIHAGDITENALSSWAARETIAYYVGRHLKYAPITSEQYQEFFAGKEWQEFSIEQAVIEGDVLYFCGN